MYNIMAGRFESAAVLRTCDIYEVLIRRLYALRVLIRRFWIRCVLVINGGFCNGCVCVGDNKNLSKKCRSDLFWYMKTVALSF